MRFLPWRGREESGGQGEAQRRALDGLRRTREAWLSRLGGLRGRGTLGDEQWEELEEALLSADVGLQTAQELVQRVRSRAQGGRLSDGQGAMSALKEEMVALIDGASPTAPAIEQEKGRPLVVMVVGVNGTGKTTSIAKLAYRFLQEGKGVVLGAGDTFRAAGVEQLQAWGERLGVDVVAHPAGGDPGAVAHDTLQAARARGLDVAIIDTAGRLHTRANLMQELGKVSRVLGRLDAAAPHVVLLTLDATVGQNGLAQARQFIDVAGCSGVFLAKLDGTARGGVVLPIARELRLPVLFVGTGERLEDMAPFDGRVFVDALLGNGEPAWASSSPGS